MDAFSDYTADGSAVTRGEFAAVITALINMSGQSGSGVFGDVEENHPYAAQISLANQLNIMVGDANGFFYPEQPVTYAQAAKCMLFVLGYTSLAERSGGYPSGYYTQAERLGVMKGLDYRTNEPIERAALARMIYNCLDLRMVDIVSVGDEVSYKNDNNETILSRYFGLRKFSGVLNAIDGRSILGRGSVGKEGLAEIGSTMVSYSDSGLADLLGYRLEAYVTDTDSETERLIYAFPVKKNRELLIKIKDLIKDNSKFSLTDFYYSDSEGKEQTAALSKSGRFMYNGAFDYDFDLADLNFKTGYVKLIDHNGDDIYDVAFIWDFESFVVDSVTAEAVRCRYNKLLKKRDKALYRVLLLDGAWGGWEKMQQLSAWDVLSVAVSKDGELVTCYASRGGISGVVEAVEDGGAKITIGGRSYDVSEQYLTLPPNSSFIPIKAGLESEFYFDVTGEISAVYQTDSNSKSYGYLLGLKKENNAAADYQAKIFTEKGKAAVYTIKENIIYTDAAHDAKRVKFSDVAGDFYDGDVFKYQLVRFSASEDGIISAIERRIDATEAGYNLDRFSTDFAVGAVDSSAKYRFQDATATFGDLNDYSKLFHLSDETVIFYIPTNGGVPDEESMSIAGASIFKSGETIDNFEAIDCSDTYVAAVLLYTPESAGGSTTTTDEYFIGVSQVFTGMDEEKTEKTMLRGMFRGAEKTYIYESTDGTVPEEGGILRCVKKLDGTLVVSADNVLYSPKNTNRFFHRKSVSDDSFLPLVWAQYGRLFRKNGITVTLYDGSARPAANYLYPGCIIYKISKNKVSVADESEMVTSSGSVLSEADGTLLFMNNRYQYARELFIIDED